MSERKFYWLKLDRQFFKRHDIRIVESMPNGKDYILFYLKLLCESVSHNGELRFSETIPYNEQMLAVVTDTNPDVVRAALQTFSELNMIEFMDDGTLFMTESQKMLGSETGAAERMRKMRERNNVTPLLRNGYTEKEIDKDIEIDIDKKESKPKKEKPKRDGDIFVQYACTPLKQDDELLKLLRDYADMRAKKKKPLTDRSKKMLLNKLDTISEGNRKQALEDAIFHCWDSVYEPKNYDANGSKKGAVAPVVLEKGETDRLLRLTKEMETGS